MAVAGLVACLNLAVPQAARSAPSCSADGEAFVTVSVVSASGPAAPRCLTWSQLSGQTDVPSPSTYQVRAGTDVKSQPVSGGVSMDALLTAAGVAASGVHYTSVASSSTPASSYLSVSTHDFAAPGDPQFPFLDGPPVFYTQDNGESLNYLRPQRTRADANASDQRFTSTGGGLTVTAHLDGYLLQPDLTVTPGRIAVNKDVRVSVSATDPDASEGLTYTVDFRDGRTSTGHAGGGRQSYATTHSYTTPGTYYVYVTAVGDNGSSGTSDTVPVTVTGATTPPRRTPTPASSGPSHGNGSRSAPVGGPVNGSGSRAGGAPTPGTPARGGSEGAAGPGAGTTTPAQGDTAAGPSAAGTPAQATSSPAPSTADTTAPSGALVVGFAAAPAGAVPAGRSTAVAAPAARSAVPHPTDPPVLLAICAIVGTACLLLLGVGSELRRPSRRGRRA